MNDNGCKLLEQAKDQAVGQPGVQVLPPHDGRTIQYFELPAGSPDSSIATEWNFYRREVGRLLAEGHENRWVLIKGDLIVGIWDSEEDARSAALHQFLMQPCLIHQVRSREPVMRMSSRFWACHS